jgi:serine/threonine protein kinase/WD40 repeat protein
MTHSLSNFEPVEQLAEEFLKRYRRGERPSLSEYVQMHPELADVIREYFPGMVAMEELGSVGGAGNTPNSVQASERARIPQQVGEYRILRQVGRGGMGIVYEAVQESLGRHVALKVFPFHGLLSRTHLERFCREARAAARLHHTNIVPVFGVGKHEGIHYYAMQFIQGETLDEVLCEVRRLRAARETSATPRPASEADVSSRLVEGLLSGQFSGAALHSPAAAADAPNEGTASFPQTDGPLFRSPTAAVPSMAAETGSSSSGSSGTLSPGQSEFSSQPSGSYFRSVANIGAQVAEALEYAHHEGILHRDIKPSNLLLDSSGRVWVTDFGLAKAEDWEELTNPGDVVGTLRYMAPERFQGQADPRSDVYGLGVTLYEMLTLRPAFDDSNRAHLMKRVAHEEPPQPRKLDDHIPRDLETVVLKATAKDPACRYATAGALAEDLRRFLADRPVRARRTPLRERAWLWCRRNPAVAALAAAFAVLLIMVAAVSSVSAWRLSEEKEATSQQLHQTRKAQNETKRELYRSLVAEAKANRLSRRSGRRVRSLEILAEATRLARELQLPEDDFLDLRNETIACLPLVDLREARTWEGEPTGTFVRGFDAELERYVRFDHQRGVASVRRVGDDSEVCQVRELGRFTDVPSLVLSPDGRFLGLDGGPVLKVWRVTNRGAELLLQKPGRSLNFSPEGSRLAMASQDGAIRVYELPSGKQLNEWKTGACPGQLTFHPDKPQLAMNHPGKITVLDLDNGNKLAEFAHPGSGGDYSLEWHPDGRQLASSGREQDRCIYLCDASTGKCLHRLAGHTSDGIRLAFNPAGDLLASGSWDGTLRLWDTRTGRELFKTLSHIPYTIRFSRNGRLLAADVTDHQVRLWEVIPPCAYQSLVREPHLGEGRYGNPAVSTKHPLLAVGMQDGVGLWELPGGRPLAFLPLGHEHGVAFDPSGALISHGRTGELRWPVETVGPPGTLRIGPPQPLPLTPSRCLVATNRDGRVMASAQFGGALVWHADKGDQLIRLFPQHDVRSVAVSLNGRWAATGSHWATDVYVKVWDARTGRHVADIPVEGGSSVGFSPDDRWLLTTGGGCRLWEVGTWREGPRIGGGVFAFSPDGKVLAAETGSGAVRLVNPDTGREYARLEDPNQDRAVGLTFSTDCSQLFACTNDSPVVHVWDLRAIRAELTQRGLDWDLPPYPVAEVVTTSASQRPPMRVTVVSEVQALSQVNLGHWDEASSIYALLAEAHPDDHWFWYRSAPLCLQTGNVEGYRRVCREMLTRFGNTDKPYIAERTAKTCSLAPEAVSDLAPVLKLADQAVTGTEKHSHYRWFVLAKGLAEYRAGHYAAAVDWLNRFSPQADGAHWDATAFAGLAMAKHRLGLAPGANSTRLAEGARAALIHAQTILSQKMPDPKACRPFGSDFHDWLHAQILVHEAERLIDKDELHPSKRK